MFNNKVAIKRIEKKVSEGGIILPDLNPNADIHLGIVKALGMNDRKEARDINRRQNNVYAP